MLGFAYFHISSPVITQDSPVEDLATFKQIFDIRGLLFIKCERGLVQPDIVMFGKGMGKLSFNFPKLYFKLCVAAIPDKNRTFTELECASISWADKFKPVFNRQYHLVVHGVDLTVINNAAAHVM